MTEQKRSGGGGIGGFLVFLLLGLFAVLSMAAVILGAKAYRDAAVRSDAHGNMRIVASYLRTKLRAYDGEGRIRLESVPASAEPGAESRDSSIDCITFREEYDGELYLTRIYVWDGALREWFSDAESNFYPADGEIICPADSLRAEQEGKLLRLAFECGGTSAEVLHVLRCADTAGEAVSG